MHAMVPHPVPAIGRSPDHQPRQFLVGLPARDLEQVLPEFLFRVRVNQYILRRIVHASQVASVLRVATTPFTRRSLQQQHTGPRLAGHQRRAKGSIPAANDKHIDHFASRSRGARTFGVLLADHGL